MTRLLQRLAAAARPAGPLVRLTTSQRLARVMTAAGARSTAERAADLRRRGVILASPQPTAADLDLIEEYLRSHDQA